MRLIDVVYRAKDRELFFLERLTPYPQTRFGLPKIIYCDHPTRRNDSIPKKGRAKQPQRECRIFSNDFCGFYSRYY